MQKDILRRKDGHTNISLIKKQDQIEGKRRKGENELREGRILTAESMNFYREKGKNR